MLLGGTGVKECIEEGKYFCETQTKIVGCGVRPGSVKDTNKMVGTEILIGGNTLKLCVIKTPTSNENDNVMFVSPYKGTLIPFDSKLCNRTAYLPQEYWFSVRVYDSQYLHITHKCLKGGCSCYYFLDGIPLMLHPCRLAALLFHHRLFSQDDMFVLSGLCRGFKIVDPGTNTEYKMDNYKSILSGSMRSQMSESVRKELLKGTISLVDKPPRCIHAMGAVERPDGRLRAITDCSRPYNSINNYMQLTAEKFCFSKVEDTRTLISEGGWGGVVDISNAYRHVPVFPQHREFTGFVWDLGNGPEFYEDNYLCFGLRSAPSIFNAVSNMVVKLMLCKGIKCQGYLDDYFLAAETYSRCHSKQEELVRLLTLLGFEINESKVTLPSRSPKYLGVIIDMDSMHFRLPEEKLLKTSSLVTKLLNRKYCSRKDLERVTGYLAHVSVLVKGGRTFCRRLYSLLKATSGKRRVQFGSLYRSDLLWWDKFLRVFEGHCEIFPRSVVPFHLFTDSSGSGFGAWYRENFLFGFWGKHNYSCCHVSPPPVFDDVSSACINVKELWPVVAAFKKWGPLWAHNGVLLNTDNTQVLRMVITGRSKNVVAMSLLRELFWLCAIYDVDLKACHIRTEVNTRADKLSRLPREPKNVKNFDLPIQFSSCCVCSESSTSP